MSKSERKHFFPHSTTFSFDDAGALPDNIHAKLKSVGYL
jgi:hypothetical protein